MPRRALPDALSVAADFTIVPANRANTPSSGGPPPGLRTQEEHA